MNYHIAGQTIKLIRKQQGLTQEELASGIMERENLSKFENGKQGIKRETLALLINRLGHAANRFFPFPVSPKEYELLLQQDKLDNAIALNNIDEAEMLLSETEALLSDAQIPASFKEGIYLQTLLRCRASLRVLRGEDTQASRELLNTAIEITIPKFKAKLVNTYLLCSDEIEIICMMAELDYIQGQHGSAITLLTKLAASIRKYYVDPREKAHNLTFVIYNLSRLLGLQNKHTDALALCNEAIIEGERERAYYLLPEIKFNKACGLHSLNENDPEVRDFAYQAYYGCLALGKVSTASEIKEQALQLFKIAIH